MPPSPDKTQRLTKKSFVSRSTIETFFIKIKLDKALFSVPPGQQPHFFDSRLTYHASRSAMVGAMGAGYPLSQNWGYNNYSSYLGYNTGAATLPGYTQPISSYPPVIDPLLPPAGSTAPPTSPPGELIRSVTTSTQLLPTKGLAHQSDSSFFQMSRIKRPKRAFGH